MTTYKYKGQSLSGAKVSGVVRAYDEFEAVAKLRDTCAFITKIEPVKERGNALDKPIGFRLKDKELALLCSQFSIILTSGLSVMRCVEMVASQTRNKYTRRMLEKVAEEVGAGYSLAQSFESNAPYLPATFIETVRAGEESGTLALCFDRLHRYYERTARTRAKIISTMTYPAMVIVVAIIVFIIIAYLAFKRTERGKLVLASYAIERAPLRRLRSMSAAGRFANTMSTMLTAGLGVPRALDVTSQVVGNYLFSLGVRKVKENVERGRGIAESMAGVECFPKMLTEMVGVGERAGSLPQTLDVIGNYFDSEVETQSTRLLSVLEPVITIVLAVIVVVLLLAVYLPMFSMYGSI